MSDHFNTIIYLNQVPISQVNVKEIFIINHYKRYNIPRLYLQILNKDHLEFREIYKDFSEVPKEYIDSHLKNENCFEKRSTYASIVLISKIMK